MSSSGGVGVGSGSGEQRNLFLSFTDRERYDGGGSQQSGGEKKWRKTSGECHVLVAGQVGGFTGTVVSRSGGEKR